jgi:hypothetical protein
MEWLVEKKVLATRDINSNSASETEELIEKQEKVLDMLDKKRKVVVSFFSTNINDSLMIFFIKTNKSCIFLYRYVK